MRLQPVALAFAQATPSAPEIAKPLVGNSFEPTATTGTGTTGAKQLGLNNQTQIRPAIAKWNPATGPAGWVTTLYQNILDRAPSKQELMPQLDFVKGHGAVGTYKQFFTSQEFKEKNLPTNQVIDKLYRSILFREPESTGKQSWLETMQKGMPIEQVIEGFLASREYQEKIAKGAAPVFTLNEGT